MKIAILGGGFAGIALGWYISHYTLGAARIDVFDPAPVAMGASRISLGILNPFMGKQARYGWKGTEAVNEVHRLITEAATALESPILTSKGLLRPAVTPEQVRDFQERIKDFSQELFWWDAEECEAKIPGLHLPSTGGGLYIPTAITINVEQYLQGLWVRMARHSAQYLKFNVLNKDSLTQYDRVVIALGANTLNFKILSFLPITRIKGQIIELKWPENLPPLPMSLSSEGQIVMSPSGKSCFVGSTYEKEYHDFKSDSAFARKEILKKVTPFFPQLAHAPLIECRARIRAASKSHLPLLGKANEKVWFFTGLGSKGLLYHALAAKKLAQALLVDDPSLIYPELLSKPA